MVVTRSASRFALSIVTSLFLTCVASAQNTDPLKPLSGICRTTALTSLERRITTLNTSCDRIQARLVKLQERKTARDLKDQKEIDRLEDLYGVQITRCSDSFIDIDPGAGLKYDTAACSVIDEPGLDRAESLLQEKLKAARSKRLRDAQFTVDIGRTNQVCERARDARESIVWLKSQCGALKAGQ